MSLTKAKLRGLISVSLQSLTDLEKRRQSDIVIGKLLKHPKYKEAQKISIYLSTNNEIDTIPILKQALDIDKKRCFIPMIRASQSRGAPRMAMVEIESMNRYDELKVNQYGIKEPREQDRLLEVDMGDLDLMIVPGVAFSLDGSRLGHGKGYYDEFLNHWKNSCHSKLYCIGLAFKEQMVGDTLAQEEHDYRLDQILVPE